MGPRRLDDGDAELRPMSAQSGGDRDAVSPAVDGDDVEPVPVGRSDTAAAVGRRICDGIHDALPNSTMQAFEQQPDAGTNTCRFSYNNLS